MASTPWDFKSDKGKVLEGTTETCLDIRRRLAEASTLT